MAWSLAQNTLLKKALRHANLHPSVGGTLSEDKNRSPNGMLMKIPSFHFLLRRHIVTSFYSVSMFSAWRHELTTSLNTKKIVLAYILMNGGY